MDFIVKVRNVRKERKGTTTKPVFFLFILCIEFDEAVQVIFYELRFPYPILLVGLIQVIEFVKPFNGRWLMNRLVRRFVTSLASPTILVIW